VAQRNDACALLLRPFSGIECLPEARLLLHVLEKLVDGDFENALQGAAPSEEGGGLQLELCAGIDPEAGGRLPRLAGDWTATAR
jgi:hypothetical protein